MEVDMNAEQLADIGIPILVTLVSYLTFRWANNAPGRRETLIESDRLGHPRFE